MGVIDFENVQKVYPNGTHALRQVSLSIEEGEFVFFIGESGAGKSTLIKLLTREERPTSGVVRLDGLAIDELTERQVPLLRRRVGMIFQDFRLIDARTVEENVAFAMEIIGAPREEIKRRVSLVLAVVGLRHKAKVYPAELSGGEAQRVGIARALVNNPRLILADEPTGNLDPANGEAIMALLERINRNGTTIVACTHDHQLVNKMQKRVIELEDGMVRRDQRCGIYYCVPTEPDMSGVNTQKQQVQDEATDPYLPETAEGVRESEEALKEFSATVPTADEMEAVVELEEELTRQRAEKRRMAEEKSDRNLTDHLKEDSEARKQRPSLNERTEEMRRIIRTMNERARQREARAAARRAERSEGKEDTEHEVE